MNKHKIGSRKLYANACHTGNFGLMDYKIKEKTKAKYKKELEENGIDIDSCRGSRNFKNVNKDIPYHRKSECLKDFLYLKQKIKNSKDRRCKKGSNVKVRTYLKNLMLNDLNDID